MHIGCHHAHEMLLLYGNISIYSQVSAESFNSNISNKFYKATNRKFSSDNVKKSFLFQLLAKYQRIEQYYNTQLKDIKFYNI